MLAIVFLTINVTLRINAYLLFLRCSESQPTQLSLQLAAVIVEKLRPIKDAEEFFQFRRKLKKFDDGTCSLSKMVRPSRIFSNNLARNLLPFNLQP